MALKPNPRPEDLRDLIQGVEDKAGEHGKARFLAKQGFVVCVDLNITVNYLIDCREEAAQSDLDLVELIIHRRRAAKLKMIEMLQASLGA